MSFFPRSLKILILIDFTFADASISKHIINLLLYSTDEENRIVDFVTEYNVKQFHDE